MIELMPESNFKFLEEKLPDLAALGDFAEQYVYADPQSSVVKLRTFTEKFVEIIYTIRNIDGTAYQDNLFEQLNNDEFLRVVPKTVINLLHSLRINGNKAAHGSEITSDIIIELLKQSHELAKWIFGTYCNGDINNVPVFSEPTQKVKTDEWKSERNKILKDLYEKEKQLQEAIEQLQNERQIAESKARKQEELDTFVVRGQEVVNELKYSEEETRKFLIDEELSKTGWHIGANKQDTDEVRQEFPIEDQPNESGIGYADYVLFDDDEKPLAVIEAKKTSKDVSIGKKQAQLYADGLEKKYGQRPIIFYTNGFETYIYNDTSNEHPRKIYGFYSKDSLQYLIVQRSSRTKASEVKINFNITDRPYQIEAIKRVLEKFETHGRKALIVQATGTGKTRVAISLADVLTRANWVKRILFLCDRRELRKQAKNVFSEYLPGTPLTILNSRTSKDRNQRIYLATYPAMKQFYQSFDVGFFDLIIADESHRSIYKVYKDIFTYFDCYQIGLTATPVGFINRNTFRMFDCGDDNPTAYFSYEDAVQSEPQYLSSFEVFNVTTKFLRDGIKYSEMSREQQLQLEEQVSDPEYFEFDSEQIDKAIYNEDTNRKIIRNLMENGIKLPDGKLGKSIIFARNHRHAVILKEKFNELYRQYGESYCQVIDNYDPRADQLISDFKGIGNQDIRIAISVDMLDTGIDVPELLNLVFAKPVKSYVKFWQMIGRGTRIKKDLFGEGKHKTKFRIFDHWSNFEWFDLHYKPSQPAESKGLLQRVFDERINLGETALKQYDQETFAFVSKQILKDVNRLAETDTVSVKERIKEIKLLQSEQVINNFSGDVKHKLRNIAPLMQWVDIWGQSDAYNFDLLIAKAQNSLLLKSGSFDDYKGEIINSVQSLQETIHQVRAKSEIIKQLQSKEFWNDVTTSALENVRQELRSIMKYHDRGGIEDYEPPKIDVKDGDLEYTQYDVKNKGVEMRAYKERVEDVLVRLIDKSPTLQKIKRGQSVNDKDIQELISLVLTQHPDVNLELLKEFYPDTANHLDLAIRRIIGLDPEYISQQFQSFIKENPNLNSTQLKFIQLLTNHIAKYGTLKLENLFEPPFTTIDSDGVYGIFPSEEQAEKIINIVREISYPYNQPRSEK